MIKIKYNSDENLVKSIKELLITTNGHCPCSLLRDESTLCICKKFRDFVKEGNTGLCHCGLYESYDDGE